MSDPASPQGRYEAWLAKKGLAVANVREATLQDSGAWHFYYVGEAPGAKAHAAAVNGETLVAPKQPEGWGAFLRTASPAQLHAQVAWLHGAWGTLEPGTPTADAVLARFPDAASVVSAPTLVAGDEENVTFTAWYFEPPARGPFRYTITVATGGTTFTRARLEEVPKP